MHFIVFIAHPNQRAGGWEGVRKFKDDKSNDNTTSYLKIVINK